MNDTEFSNLCLNIVKSAKFELCSTGNGSNFLIYVISVLLPLCFRAHLFIDALWSPAGKGLTSSLSFVMSNCEVVTFPLVSWVRCDA